MSCLQYRKLLFVIISAAFIIAALLSSDLGRAQPGGGGLIEEDLTTEAQKPGADDGEWKAVLELAGAKLPEGKTVSDLFGTLPTGDELLAAGSLSPGAFLKLYQGSDQPTRIVMQRFVRARIRELGRRGAWRPALIDALLGEEGQGAHGSYFFGVPPVPAESYQALVRYLEFCANELEPGYQSNEASRARIDRWLQASLALSTVAGRLQYSDFDVVWSSLERDLSMIGPEQRRKQLPGRIWLYAQLRWATGMEFLPPAPETLEREVEAEAGALFLKARAESRELSASLTSLTAWQQKLIERIAPSSGPEQGGMEPPSP